MIFGDEEAKRFNEATVCWICKKEFDDTADKNVIKIKIEKLGIIVIIQEDTEEPRITLVTLNIGNLNLYLSYLACSII